MSGISIGHSISRPCSGEKTLRRCKNNQGSDNIILIDVDTDDFDNVVIIDVPESLPKKTKPSSMLRKDKKSSFRNVIYIDDDENHGINHYFGVNDAGFSAGTPSNGESFHVTKNILDSAFEKYQYAQDTAPVRLSKCKGTYSGKASMRNRYGLNADSESDSSDNDCPDCELVEDSSGKVQEQWEKASSRRKKNLQNGYLDIRDRDNTSFDFSTGGLSNEKDDPSCFKEDTDLGRTHAFDVSVDHCESGSSNRVFEENCERLASYSSAFSKQSDKEFDHPTPAFEDEEPSEAEPCPPTFKPCVDEDSVYMSENSFETEVNPRAFFPGDNHKNFTETATGDAQKREHLESGKPHANGGAEEMDNLMPERCTFKRSTLRHKQNDHSSTLFSSAVGSASGESSFSIGLRNTHLNEAKLQEDISMSNIQQEEDKDGQLHSQNGETLPSVEICIINGREKLKETDEYKRAMEEEWASRQQALQIQAEEAKRLRRLQKRRNAESMRLLDMDRRQKQRIEEVRNIQKKDEENINLKERIRAEVRSELNKLEVSCHSMASLLHSLGIRVGGWPNPLAQEVQTAYKRALLTFHPDRASQSDLNLQVEAEEKFKLINRLKEKFSPSL